MPNVFSVLVRHLPPSHVMARVAPFFTLAIALIAGFWTLFQYSNQLAIERTRTAFDLHKQYQATFGVNGAYGRLPAHLDDKAYNTLATPARCRFLVSQGKMPVPAKGCAAPNSAVLAQMGVVTKGLTRQQRVALRDVLEAVQAAVPWTQDDLHSLDALLVFLHSVMVCVDQRACDEKTTLSLFKREIIPLLNATCGRIALNQIQKADAVEVARVVHDIDGTNPPPWSSDKGQTDQFLCNWLRGV